MPTSNGFSTGQDNKIIVIDSIFGRLDLGTITDFDAKEKSKTLTVMPMSGPELVDEIPQGWDGSFGADRTGPALDDYIVARAARYFATGQLPTVAIFQYVTEANGAQSVYQFLKVALKFTDSGKWANADSVKAKITFQASTKIKVS